MILLANSLDFIPQALKSWGGFGWFLCVCLGLGWLLDSRRKWAEKIKLTEESNKLREESNKLVAEVTKLKTEEIKLAADVLEKVQRARDSYSEACVLATKAVISLTESIKRGNDSEVIPERNAFCEIVTSKVIHRYGSLVEWECLSRKHPPERLVSYIQNDVLAEVAKITDWIRVINLPMFQERYGANPLLISDQTLRPFADICYSRPDQYAGPVKESIYSCMKKLQAA